MKRIAIIGGGASGIVASIFAKNEQTEVTLFEKNSVLGKKLLITGNGRCNFWNEDMNLSHFHSKELVDISPYFSSEVIQQVLPFFQSLGLVFRNKNGYYYPCSNQAQSVKNVLFFELKRKQVEVKTDFLVKEIRKEGDFFFINPSEENLKFDFVVLATGSKAYPKTGSTGDGYLFARSFSHTIVPPLPALVPLRIQGNYGFDGVRVEGKASIYHNQKLIREEEGEIQLSSSSVSGICIFNLSRYANTENVTLKINFVPFVKTDVSQWFEHLACEHPEKTVSEILDGFLNYKLGNEILKCSHIPSHFNYKELSQSQKNSLMEHLSQFPFQVIGTKDYSDGQVCTGGISLKEVDSNFQSKRVPNLYFTGEILDIDGDCGGYNLGFAWMSGIAVGKAILSSVRDD